jgi:hypothetical protein
LNASPKGPNKAKRVAVNRLDACSGPSTSRSVISDHGIEKIVRNLERLTPVLSIFSMQPACDLGSSENPP